MIFHVDIDVGLADVDLDVDLVNVDLDVDLVDVVTLLTLTLTLKFRIFDFSNFRKLKDRVWML